MPSLDALQTFVARRLTPDRVRFYCLSVIAVNCLFLALQFATSDNYRTKFGYALGGDFAAFYNAGTIFNNYDHSRIYDLDLHDRLYHELAPDEPPNASLPFGYAPFFVLPFAPIALLPYPLAYLSWLLISAALYVTGFLLAWEATDAVPREFKSTALLLALAFVPLLMYCLTGGQVSAFGFFCFAAAIHCDKRRRHIASGLALALLLYKPPLLFFVFPMLLITRRVWTLAGLLLGLALLALLSLLLVGWQGILAYVNLLLLYRRATSGPELIFQIWKFVDIGSFLRLLLPPGHLFFSILRFVALGAVLPPLILSWWRVGRSQMAWALTITWSLVVNLYVPIYDTTFVVLSLLLTADALYHARLVLPAAFKTLLVLLFVVPWFTVHVAEAAGVQVYTLVIASLGLYQFSLVLKHGGLHRGARSAVVRAP